METRNMQPTQSIYVIMGVSGSGKSTIGTMLAQRLTLPMFDGDDFHPPENVRKMAQGIPLMDEDRLPWLVRLHTLIADHSFRGQRAVVVCSCLKHQYREQLRAGLSNVQFVYLQGSFALIQQRMLRRQNHYMKVDMLPSQFDALEPPAPNEALTIDADQPPSVIVEQILAWITKQGS